MSDVSPEKMTQLICSFFFLSFRRDLNSVSNCAQIWQDVKFFLIKLSKDFFIWAATTLIP